MVVYLPLPETEISCRSGTEPYSRYTLHKIHTAASSQEELSLILEHSGLS